MNNEGRLEKVNKLSDVPGPIDDEQMMPFWMPALSGQVQLELPLPELRRVGFFQDYNLRGWVLGNHLRLRVTPFRQSLSKEWAFGACVRDETRAMGDFGKSGIFLPSAWRKDAYGK